MKKTITTLCLLAGLSLYSGHTYGQSRAQQSATATTAMQNAVKITVSSGTKAHVDFLNTGSEDLVFTWSIHNAKGEVTFTSGIVKLKPGTTSTSAEARMLDGVNANQITISLKK